MESFHPMVVHFPIALLGSAVLMDWVALIGKWTPLYRVSLANFCLGTVGAAVAVLTGLQAEKVAKHSFEIWKVMERHEQMGITALILALGIVGVRLWKRDVFQVKGRLGLLALGGILVGVLCYSAHLGGKMVYEMGVGGTFGKVQ